MEIVVIEGVTYFNKQVVNFENRIGYTSIQGTLYELHFDAGAFEAEVFKVNTFTGEINKNSSEKVRILI